MATALTAQLAEIRARSTHPLDLKEKKRAHSQSLLFDPTIAATQDFDSLFQICHEGFVELCRLDNRFQTFERSLFSPKSIHQDRTQINESTNRQLDKLLENFFILVSSKLLLRSALKCMEWLIRRYSAHLDNTDVFVMAFLPYHNHSIFSDILSLLPYEKASKFLHPYIKSLACPPYQVIVRGLSHDRRFLSNLNKFVLGCCISDTTFSSQMSLWSSVFSEVIPILYESCQSSNRKKQAQNEHEILVFLLPLLNNALSVKTPSQFIYAKYQVLNIFISHAVPERVVLEALAETIVANWSPPNQAGLLCLSILAANLGDLGLPEKVISVLLGLDSLVEDMLALHERYDLDLFISAFVPSIVRQIRTRDDVKASIILRRLLNTPLLDGLYRSTNRRLLQEAILQPHNPMEQSIQSQEILEDIAKRLSVNEPSLAVFKNKLPSSAEAFEEMRNTAEKSSVSQEDFDRMVSQIPTRTAHETSFLCHSRSFIFPSLENTFCKIVGSPSLIRRFAELPVLRRSLGMKEPFFISFYVRLWCSRLAAPARSASIRVVTDCLREGISADPQFLLPYVLHGVLDSSSQVRQSIASLALELYSFYTRQSVPAESSGPLILGENDVYGPGNSSRSVSWLSIEHTKRFLEMCILPTLQDGFWEPTHAVQLIVSGLRGVHRSPASQSIPSHLKSSVRSAILANLCSHIMNTPLYAVKITLLNVVTKIEKASSQSSSTLLLPLFKIFGEMEASALKSICDKESIDLSEILTAITSIVTPKDYEGIMYMKSLIEGVSMTTASPDFLDACIERLRINFPTMRPDWQVQIISSFLIEISSEGRDVRPSSHVMLINKALGTLPISSQCLAQILRQAHLPDLSSGIDATRHKRRRLGPSLAHENSSSLGENIELKKRKLIAALEITDKAGVEYDASLLAILSQLFADLRSSGQGSSHGTSYLQLLLLDRMLTLARAGEKSQGFEQAAAKVNPEAIISCILQESSLPTRNTGLLLLSVLSRTLPDRILHSIMPVFTSIGSSYTHPEDDFSVYVVRQTLDLVIPPLLGSLRKRKNKALSSISNLLAGFAAAFNHMPSAVRFETYTLLVAKIGQDSFLYILIALLVKANQKSKKVLQFASEILSQYSITTQVSVVDQYLNLVLDLLKSDPEEALDIFSSSSANECRLIAVDLLAFIPSYLSTIHFIENIQKELLESSHRSSTVLGRIEESLNKAIVLSQMSKANQGDLNHFSRPLDSLLRLLPTPSLVNIISSLLERTRVQNRPHILLILRTRLQLGRDINLSQGPCLRLLVDLLDMLSRETDPILLVSILKCTGQIVQLFGRTNTEAVMSCIQPLTDPSCLNSPDDEVRCQSLLCVSSVVEAVRAALMPVLPQVLSSSLDALDHSMLPKKNINLHDAAYAVLCSILAHSAIVMTGSNLDRFIALSGKSACSNLGDESDIIRREAHSLISLHIEPGDCLLALSRTWRLAMFEGFSAMVAHVNLVKTVVQRLSKSAVTNVQELFEDNLIQILDLRHSQTTPETAPKYTDTQIDALEGVTNEVTMALIYKLNDTTFKPFFHRLLDWAFQTDAENSDVIPIPRRSTLYHFLSVFFDDLKSVVTSYASYVLVDTAAILSRIRPVDPDSRSLWRRVVRMLRITLQHDQDDFYQIPSHFSQTTSALLGQLATVEAMLVQEEIVPTVVELASTVQSAEQRKEINSALLQHMRSSKPSIRLGAIRCQHALVNQLGHHWLALLPEMLPLISELQEDDDEKVENETLRWVAKIEETLGESLAPMLR